MAAVNVVEVRAFDGEAKIGYRYDDASLLITHLGAINNLSRAVWVEVIHTPSGNSRSRTIQPESQDFVDISGLNLHMIDEGGILIPPFSFSTRVPS